MGTRRAGYVWIAALTAGFMALAIGLFEGALRFWQAVVVAIAGVEAMVAFGIQLRVIGQSAKKFFAAFTGGMLSRAVLLAIVGILLVKAGVPVAIPLLSLAFLFSLFNLLQAAFLRRPA